ncbi:MAG TPA: glycosyltransferase family 2 protein [Longimicrobiales bacterium]|nr:glycosyltransferase family 2 protein [Longimicrobiales bacterium]
MKKLTIGIPTFDDFDGVWFTIQALRLYHAEVSDRIEYIIVDNNPGSRHGELCRELTGWVRNGGRTACAYVPLEPRRGTAVAKNAVFEHATTEYVLCTDCHVLFVPGAIQRLLDYFGRHDGSRDLLQGVLLYDDLRTVSTHFRTTNRDGSPLWSSGMLGEWATDERGVDPDAEPFEIEMTGMGVFACERTAWPGFNRHFEGFGGEEGYVQERFRRNGGRALCLPFLGWLHRFERPRGVPYPNILEERMRNYVIGHRENGFDEAPVIAHFTELLGREKVELVMAALIHPEAREGTTDAIAEDAVTTMRESRIVGSVPSVTSAVLSD